MARPGNLLSEWSRLVLGILARSGVEELIVSPGSRSTPFLWAALREPRLRCRSVIDERAAAFVALGLGRTQGRAAAVLCTSGTAPAHFYPAVIEAKLARVPLVVLSADRARVDQNIASPQTIDQTRLFGAFAEYLELGDPIPERRAFERVARILRSALERAQDGAPLQVNLPADKPLEPRTATTHEERALSSWVDELLGAPPRVVGRATVPPREGLDLILDALESARSPLVVAGALPAESARAVVGLAARLGAPLVAEAGANAPSAVPPEFVVGRPRATFDLVVAFGPPLTSGAFQRWLLEDDAPRQVLVHGSDEGDPTASAALRVLAEPKDCAEALTELVPPRGEPPVLELEGSVERALGRLRRPEASEAGLVLAALRGLPPGLPTLLGNSLAIRLADAVVSALPEPRPRFQVQRGANGIDGLVAGAQGARLANPSGAAVLLGDVSLAHDLTSLSLFRELDVPLVVLLLDNDGGRLFDHLPMRAEVTEEHEWAFFRTAPRLDFASAARTFGIRYFSPSPEEVSAVVRECSTLPGATLIHLRADPEETATFFQALRAEYDA